MAVGVVHVVVDVRMLVIGRVVMMWMRVLAGERRVVAVVVMVVVVAMQVSVILGGVMVRVFVLLAEVQVHAEPE